MKWKMSLPVRGAWIEICMSACPSASGRCRSPCGERGLKCDLLENLVKLRLSLPVRGAWIEIPSTCHTKNTALSLPVRGAWIEMLFMFVRIIEINASLPVRGAWIEIYNLLKEKAGFSSLPVRGAWIEISTVRTDDGLSQCRSPCGERGLK